MISSAEEGSAVAVLNPELMMIPEFGGRIQTQMSLLIRETDSEWADYLRDWILENNLLGNLERIRNHWIRFQSADSPGD